MTFSVCYLRWVTLLQLLVWEMFFLFFSPPLFLSDLIPLCWLLTMYHIGQPWWGDNKSLWDKAIYIGPVLTLWGWEIGVEGRLVNTAEIAAACGSQEKLETTVPMKEKIVFEKKKDDKIRWDLNKNGPFSSHSPLFWIRLEMSGCYWSYSVRLLF